MKNIRYPCKKCLIQPSCKIPCDPFGVFIKRVDKLFDIMEQIVYPISDMITPDSKIDRAFDWLLKNVITQVVFYLVKSIFGVELHPTKWTLFDERHDAWSKMKDNEE